MNGCFSAGKSTVAALLVERLGDAFLLDPEMIGVALRDHLVRRRDNDDEHVLIPMRVDADHVIQLICKHP
jgi:hypothetical protein